MHFEGDLCQDWMETTASSKHFQQEQQEQQRTQEGLHATKLQMERVATQLAFEEFRPSKL